MHTYLHIKYIYINGTYHLSIHPGIRGHKGYTCNPDTGKLLVPFMKSGIAFMIFQGLQV